MQVGNDLTATNINHDVTLHRRINAAYRIDACNSGGCTPSSALTLAPQLVPAIGYVKASNTEAGDFFGQSVAVSADGDTLAIGASSEASNATGLGGNQSDNSANGAGAVYVFTRDAGVWSQQAYVKASNTGAFDSFGVSVALSADGNTLAVVRTMKRATPRASTATRPTTPPSTPARSTCSRGAGGRGSATGLHQGIQHGVGDFFGLSSVALSGDGNTLAVGADWEASNATGIGGNQADTSAQQAPRCGLRVHAERGDVVATGLHQGIQHRRLRPTSAPAWRCPGTATRWRSVPYREASNATGIDGNQADDSADDAGAAYVFKRSAGNIWLQQAYIKASNTGGDDNFGSSVALSGDGNTLAVGAYKEDSSALRASTATRPTTPSSTPARPTCSRGAVGDVVAAGVRQGVQHRRLLLITSATAWRCPGTATRWRSVLPTGKQQRHGHRRQPGRRQLRRRLPLARPTCSRGAVGTWSQQAYVKASIADVNDGFSTVALSGDGSLLAVGAKGEASAAAGIGANQSDNSASNAGAVYLF